MQRRYVFHGHGRTYPLRAFWLACLLVAAGLPARAAESDEVETQVPERARPVEEIVVVGARLPRPVEDVVGTVDVISYADLVETLALRPPDLLRYTPGVSFSRSDTRFGDSSISIRGLSGNRVTTLIDRVPVPDAFSVGSFSNSGQEFFVPDVISRIEVLRGPASTLFGSDALGGVVAVVTRDPEELLAGRDLAASVFTGYSGADEGFSLGVTGAGRLGLMSSLLHASGSLGNELDASATHATDELDRSRYSFLGKVHFALPWGGTLRLKGDTFSEEVETELEAIRGFGRQFRNTTDLSGDDERSRSSVVIGLDVEPTVLADYAVLDLYWHRSRTEQITEEERLIAEPPVAITRRFEYEYEDLGLLLDLESRLPIAGLDNRIGWGLSLRGSQVESLRDGRQQNLESGEVTNVLLSEELPVRDFPTSRILEFGVYVHDEIRWGDFTLVPGLRFEYYELDARPDALFSDANPSVTAVDITDTAWVPKLGLLYKASDSLELFAQYARGFRAPPFGDVNIGLDLPMFNVRAIPNPDLEAETSDGVEFGMRWHTNSFRAHVALFGALYDNFIATKVPLGPDPETGVLLFQSQNIDEARIYGAEIGFWTSFDRWVKGLSFEVAGSWIRGENRVTDERLDTVDPPELVSWLRWDPLPVVGAGFAVTAVAKPSDVDDSQIEPFVPAGYVSLDLLVSVRPMPGLRIDAGIFNLADQEHWRWSSVRGRTEEDPLIDLLSEPGRYGAISFHLDL